MPFTKGHKLATGRPRGVANKITSDVRDMIREALDNAGGTAYLTQQATRNPTAFLALLGKVVPAEVNVKFSNPLLTMGLSDVAKLAVAISRERGISIPSSFANLAGEEARSLPALQEAERVP